MIWAFPAEQQNNDVIPARSRHLSAFIFWLTLRASASLVANPVPPRTIMWLVYVWFRFFIAAFSYWFVPFIFDVPFIEIRFPVGEKAGRKKWLTTI
jgi:hypothetical protein